MTELILASASPRRRQLLEQIGVCFSVQPADIDESILPGETPEAYVERMSRSKALALESDHVILASDTAVVCDGQIYGKPEDETHAEEMLMHLSGRCHHVLSGVCCRHGAHIEYRLSSSRIWFRPLHKEQIKRYWQTGEPCDKAGAYGIQGLGAVFVEKMEGSFTGVMGLPLEITTGLLDIFNIPVWQAG